MAIRLFLCVLILTGCDRVSNLVNPPPRNPDGTLATEADLVRLLEVAPDIVSLTVAPALGGVIVTTTARADRQDYWGAVLERTGIEGGTLTYTFRLVPPEGAAPVGSAPSREVLTGVFLSDAEISGLRQIVVQGARSSRSARF